jgi:hypothetical protein
LILEVQILAGFFGEKNKIKAILNHELQVAIVLNSTWDSGKCSLFCGWGVQHVIAFKLK